MRKFAFSILGAAIICSLLPTARASIQIGANPVNGEWVEFDGGSFRQGTGGPFLGILASTEGGLSTSSRQWYTFCVETDGGSETIGLGGHYRVGSTSQYVATATGNVVTNAAKYLYYAYGHDLLTSLLPGYVNNAAMNEQVQMAIWSLVVKTSPLADPNSYATPYAPNGNGYWLNVGGLSADATTLRAAAITAVANAANLALADRIRVINPDSGYPPAGEEAQSMLYEVPEAATIVVWSLLGMIGVCRYRRRGC